MVIENYQAPLVDVHEKKLSIRTAAAAHGVAKSTLYEYASGKMK